MACERCTPFFTRPEDDRVRAELDGTFEIIDEQQEKYDSSTMWWHGKARCKTCGQIVDFDYRQGVDNTGTVTKSS